MLKKLNPKLSTPILYIIVGALLIIFKKDLIGVAMSIIGAFFIASGVLEIIKKNNKVGIINLVIGVAVIVLGWVAATIVLLVLGLLLAAKGVLPLIELIKREDKKLIDFIVPVITILAGLAVAFGNVVDVVLVIGGVILAADGALALYGELKK